MEQHLRLIRERLDSHEASVSVIKTSAHGFQGGRFNALSNAFRSCTGSPWETMTPLFPMFRGGCRLEPCPIVAVAVQCNGEILVDYDGVIILAK